MKKREFTINYQKKSDPSGTVYKQTINITENTFEDLQGKLQAELVLPRYKIDDYYARLYLKSPLERVGNIVFINLTQRDFFNKYLKLKLRDENTCFCIIKNKKHKIFDASKRDFIKKTKFNFVKSILKSIFKK